ncbi:vacuolar protein sorting-associated protein 28 homolog 1-like [Wolffia australiana]
MEVKLWGDKRERDSYENLAELYAIIKTTEKLEKAFVRDLVPAAAYEAECRKLIGQFKNLAAVLRHVVPSVDDFAAAHRMDCPAAVHRLVVAAVPATDEHRVVAAASAASAVGMVAECVQHFITAMDVLKLNMVAVDQVHPHLTDLSSSLGKLAGILPPDFEGRAKIKDWISRLSKMAAADELTDQQARQLSFDLESSYNAFMVALPKQNY